MKDRFDNMPERLRQCGQSLGRRYAIITDGQRMAFQDLLDDAALLIEALERENHIFAMSDADVVSEAVSQGVDVDAFATKMRDFVDSIKERD